MFEMKKTLCIVLVLTGFVMITARAQDVSSAILPATLLLDRYDYFYPTYEVNDSIPASTQIVYLDDEISIEFQKDSLSRKYRLVFDKKTTRLMVENNGKEDVLYCACGKSKNDIIVNYVIKSDPVQHVGEYSKVPGIQTFKEELQKFLSLKNKQLLFVQIEIITLSTKSEIIKSSRIATVIIKK
jgi:hypothetical protein